MKFINSIATFTHQLTLQVSLVYFLNQISNFIPRIDNSFKEICDSDLKIEELDAVVKWLSIIKASGTGT